jgi:farnesyl diphosphate synthase
MTELDRFLTEVRSSIDDMLDRLVPTPDREPRRLYEAIRWSLFGDAKRFRPALLLAAGRAFGAGDESLFRAAAAVEMLHTYSLIHDDLPAMDDDDMRRGRATIHKKFDEATAVLAGDALQALAFETIAGDQLLAPRTRLTLVSELAIAAGRMVAGQQLDLEAEGKSVDLDSIKHMHAGKTGALIRYALRAGALIGEADEIEMSGIGRFGEKLGLLYQITDDILDRTSTSETLGKTAGKDAASQKATYAELLGVDRARELAGEISTEAIDVLGPEARKNSLLPAICRHVAGRCA